MRDASRYKKAAGIKVRDSKAWAGDLADITERNDHILVLFVQEEMAGFGARFNVRKEEKRVY